MEKRLIPEIRFKGFLGDWEEKKLNQIVDRVTRKNSDLSSNLPLTISAQDGLIAQNQYYGRQIASKNISGYYKILKGEFAYNKSYSNGHPYGAIKRLEKHSDGVLSTLYILFKVRNGDSNFIKYYFESDYWHRSIVKISAEGARNHGLLNIPVNDFFKIYVKTPEIDEQEKIGRLFEKLEQTIDLQGKVLEENKRLKQALLQKLFPKKGQKLPELRLKGFSGDWEEKKLGNIVDIGSSKRVHQKDWRSEGIPFYRARDLVAFAQKRIISEPLFIEESKFDEYSKMTGKPKANDLLVTGVGTIGVPFLVKENKDFYFKDGNIVWIKNDAFDGDFLYYSFLSERIQNYIFRIAGIGTVATYTIQGCKNTPIIFPSLPEQEAIGNLFRSLDEKIESEEERLEGYKTLKKSLLQKMFV